jgi:hypothetical protein
MTVSRCWTRRIGRLLFAPLLAGAAAVTVPAADLKIDRLHWEKDVDGPAPITRLEIRNDFGDVRARRAGDRRIEASAVVQRLDADPAGVGFTVERHGPVVALVVAYPPGHVRDADPNPPKDSYDRLDLVVYVPEGVALRAETLRGRIEIRGLKSDVEAATLDGPLSVVTTGSVRARTAGGAITAIVEASALAHPENGPMLFESGTGAITVTVPERAPIDLRAETSGPLSSELRMHRKQGARTRAWKASGRSRRLVLVRSDSGAIQVLRDER